MEYMMELANSVMAAKQSAILQTASIKVLKKQHEMQMALINMIAEVASSAPPPSGQGTIVDKFV